MLSFRIILINGNIEIYGFILRLQPCPFLLIPGFQPQSLYNLADFPQTLLFPDYQQPLAVNPPYFEDLLVLRWLLLHLVGGLGST